MPSALAGFDAVLVRTMPPGSLEQVVFRMDLLHRLQARGVRVLNPPRAVEICVDKYLATACLEAAGLRVPPTIVCQHADAALEAFAALGGDVVVKPLFGSEGRGMVRISDPEMAWRTFRTLERTQQRALLAAIHPPSRLGLARLRARRPRAGGDASCRRTATGAPTWPRAATARRWRCASEQRDLAVRAAAALGATAAGVDLLPGPDGEWYVLEVNAVPGWRALAPVTGVDIAAALVRFRPRVASQGDAHAGHRLVRADRLHLGGDGPQTGQRPPLSRFRGYELSRFPRQRRRHRACADNGLSPAASAKPRLACVQATRSVVRTNTNLGIILLLAPLAAVRRR